MDKRNARPIDEEYDEYGFNKEGINKETGTSYDLEGYDRQGFNKNGTHRDTGTKYDKEGYDREGFNYHGINKYTHTKYNQQGFDSRGYDKEGYDKRGFNIAGFNREGLNRFTNTKYSESGYGIDGFNRNGYDLSGYNREGYNKQGFDREGFDREGFNRRGFGRDGYNREGFNQRGFDRDGFNKEGFNEEGIHRDTGTKFNKEGFDKDGYDKDGFNRDGIDRAGKDRQEREETRKEQTRNWIALKEKAIKLASGQMTVEEYIMKSKTSIDDLILFAKKQHLGADVIRNLTKCRGTYKMYKRPFNKAEYLKTTSLLINGEIVKPTEQDVDVCIEYLKANNVMICDATVRSTISQFKRGELDITKKTDRLVEESTQTQLESLESEQGRLTKVLDDVHKLEMEVYRQDGKDNLKK